MKWITLYKIDLDGTRQDPLLELNVRLADGYFSRLRGLLGRKRLEPSEGLLLTRCASVHTFGMGYPLDLVFLDRSCRVIKCCEGVKPCRTASARAAYYTLELSAGTLRRQKISIDDQISIHQEEAS
jgi:uncharacterized membrane protein (UPF0127 family)